MRWGWERKREGKRGVAGEDGGGGEIQRRGGENERAFSHSVFLSSVGSMLSFHILTQIGLL